MLQTTTTKNRYLKYTVLATATATWCRPDYGFRESMVENGERVLYLKIPRVESRASDVDCVLSHPGRETVLRVLVSCARVVSGPRGRCHLCLPWRGWLLAGLLGERRAGHPHGRRDKEKECLRERKRCSQGWGYSSSPARLGSVLRSLSSTGCFGG